MNPIKNRVYTLRQVFQLRLRDTPHLGFAGPRGARCVIQTSHLMEVDLLAVPGWADTQWKYLYETDEWIPVFQYVGPIKTLVDLLHIEVELNPYLAEDDGVPGYWCVPVCDQRPQFYLMIDDNRYQSSYLGTEVYELSAGHHKAKVDLEEFLLRVKHEQPVV